MISLSHLSLGVAEASGIPITAEATWDPINQDDGTSVPVASTARQRVKLPSSFCHLGSGLAGCWCFGMFQA